MASKGWLFAEKDMVTQVCLGRKPLKGTAGFIPYPLPLFWSKSGQREEAGNARGKGEACRVTTRTIFRKGRNKAVPRNSKQGVDEQLKLTFCLYGIQPQHKQPRPLPGCANQGHGSYTRTGRQGGK